MSIQELETAIKKLSAKEIAILGTGQLNREGVKTP